MGNKIRIIIAALFMVGMAIWTVERVREHSYSGSKIAFNVGSGSVVVTNRGNAPIPVSMRADGRASSFRIDSTELNLRENSKRQSSGRGAYHVVEFDLAPGRAKIEVTRGSNVLFISGTSQRIDAVVTPMSQSSARGTLVFAGLVELGALYYISGRLQHRWIGVLRNKLPRIALFRKRPAG
jgi:hypothetical protein